MKSILNPKILVFFVLLALCFPSCAFNSKFYVPNKENTEITWAKCKEGFFEGANDNRLHFAFFESYGNKVLATVLILHGNGGNLASCESIVMPFVRNGFQVFIFDYQGFGKSEGDPTHDNLLKDADTFLKYVKNRAQTKNKKLLVMGTSLGGQLSIALTAQNQDIIEALVVEGTFTSHKDIAVHTSSGIGRFFAKMLVSSNYNAKKLIRTISIPKLIIHSSEDEVNPYHMGVELYENAKEPKTFWEIRGGHIKGLSLYEEKYIQKVKTILN